MLLHFFSSFEFLLCDWIYILAQNSHKTFHYISANQSMSSGLLGGDVSYFKSEWMLPLVCHQRPTLEMQAIIVNLFRLVDGIGVSSSLHHPHHPYFHNVSLSVANYCPLLGYLLLTHTTTPLRTGGCQLLSTKSQPRKWNEKFFSSSALHGPQLNGISFSSFLLH